MFLTEQKQSMKVVLLRLKIKVHHISKISYTLKNEYILW